MVLLLAKGVGMGGGGTSFTAQGKVFLYTSANWTSGAAFHYEAYYRATAGTAETRLYDVDAGAAVTSGGLSTTSTSFARERTAALTLVDGNQYTAQFGGAAGGAGEAKGWTIIVVQS